MLQYSICLFKFEMAAAAAATLPAMLIQAGAQTATLGGGDVRDPTRRYKKVGRLRALPLNPRCSHGMRTCARVAERFSLICEAFV